MHISSLLPALLTSLGGGHADLHPANTNLYIEVPAIRSLTAAYEAAPLAQFFRDEEVREFAAKLTGLEGETISFTTLLEALVDELRTELPPAGVQVIDLVPQVEHLSVSLSGIELEGLADHILEAEGDWSDDLRERVGRVRLQVVMDFSSAEAAQSSVELLRSPFEDESSQAENVTVVETQLEFRGQMLDWTYVRAVDDDMEFGFWFASEGARLIVGSGLLTTLEGLFPDGNSLAESQAFVQSFAHLENEAGQQVLEAYTSLHGLDEFPRILALAPDVSPNLVGLAESVTEFLVPLGAVQAASQVRLVGSRFVTESFERDFSSDDSPRISSDEPVTRQTFAKAPADAVSVWATHLDKQGIKTLFLDWLAGFSGSEPEELLANLEEQYGFRPDRDLIDSLGGELVFYNLPFSGIGMPKMYLALELDDPEAFARGLEGLGEYLTAVGEGKVDFESRPYRKHPFASFSPGQDLDELVDGADMSFAPAFLSLAVGVGVLEDRAVLSLSSMYTKREMKRLLKADDEDRHAILTSSEELPAGLTSYGTTDYAEILAGLYDSVRGFLPLISQGGGVELPFAIEDMPDSSIFAKYFEPTRYWTRRVEGGRTTYNESSFGPEVGLMIGAGVGVAVTSFARAMESEFEPAPPQPVDPGDPGAGDPAADTRERMRKLDVSLVVYRSDVGRYPVTLADMKAPTPNFPNGILEGEELPSDGWGHSFRYDVDATGESYRLWSVGPNGADDDGGGDDLVLKE